MRLRGPFVTPNIYDVGKTISAGEFDAMLEAASERKPAAIVLRIDSPGGRVDVMDAIVERLIEVQSNVSFPRVVAWVELGASAAGLTALACKEIVMFPHGRIGSATMTLGDGEAAPAPETAADQKVAAMRDARRRQVASLTGRPIELQQAMEDPKAQLWWNPFEGLSLTRPVGEGWQAYDTDEEKPLALQANETVSLQIAKGIAGDGQRLVEVLELSPTTKVVEIDLAAEAVQRLLVPARQAADRGNAAMRNFEKRLRQEIDDIEVALRLAAAMARAEGGYSASDLASLERALKKCSTPKLDSKTREFLQLKGPDAVSDCETKLEIARRNVSRVSASVQNSRISTGIVFGPLLEDLQYAKKCLVESVLGGQ